VTCLDPLQVGCVIVQFYRSFDKSGPFIRHLLVVFLVEKAVIDP
jgi:hypothetical protein